MPESPTPPARRIFIGCRVAPAGLEVIQRRADQEAAGNQSEMVRRMLAYASVNMPKGWGAK